MTSSIKLVIASVAIVTLAAIATLAYCTARKCRKQGVPESSN